jgi:aryl-alcohol dehydrogenase-like predicted oxidoreductase
MRNHGLRRELVVLGKGGHPPNMSPEAIERELQESLDRLSTDYLDMYMLHRDSPTVPVGEFVDLLCSFLTSGQIHAYGFSNWTMERMQAARLYAQSKGLPLPAALSNNLSLAMMEKPIYPGCVSASDRAFRDWLAESGCTLIPWSSQGRGVFTAIERPEGLMSSVLADCWYSETNVERLRRAHRLARIHSVLPVNIALAWVLRQPFPTFPIIGPRSVDELESSLGALHVVLSNDELAWLNLQSEDAISASTERVPSQPSALV